MRRLQAVAALFLSLAVGLAQEPPSRQRVTELAEQTRNNRLTIEGRRSGTKDMSDEILRAEYVQTLAELDQLLKLANSLKSELEKNDRHVLSMSSISRSGELEKLARKLHQRLKKVY